MGTGDKQHMATREIAKAEWPAFLDEFSRARQGALVTIEVVDPQTGPRFPARRLPLVGLSYEDKEGESIVIIAGTEASDHLSHTVTRPVHLYHKEGAGLISEEVNPHEILEITSADYPPITSLRFEPAGSQ